MINKAKTTNSSASSTVIDVTDKAIGKKPPQVEPRAADDTAHNTDRPGFDLGGSTGDTHAGTGLGLGEDAADTPGDRRLPGRRLEGKLTIPRWRGPEPKTETKPADKTAGPKPSSAPKAKTTR